MGTKNEIGEEELARILVIDDEPDACRLLQYLFEREGHDIVLATRGQEGLQKAMEERIDLVILDVMMPGMDGYEVCRRLRAEPQTARLPVVMLTARAGAKYERVGLGVGADVYIPKPISPTQLVAEVKAMIAAMEREDD